MLFTTRESLSSNQNPGQTEKKKKKAVLTGAQRVYSISDLTENDRGLFSASSLLAASSVLLTPFIEMCTALDPEYWGG